MTEKRKWRDFEEARGFARSLGLKRNNEWRAWAKTGARPADIPSGPDKAYKEKWINWGDWLGTGHVHPANAEWQPFEEAREYVRAVGLKSSTEWRPWSKSAQKPQDIPAGPRRVYKEEWVSWGDWLGTGNISNPDKHKGFRSFEEARAFARTLGLKNGGEWLEYCRYGKRPRDIPSNPNVTYKLEWAGMGDWLGTGRIASQDKEWRPFLEARSFATTLGLKGNAQWRVYARSSRKPSDIPANPDKVYEDAGWVSWGDWLGTGNTYKGEWRPFEKARQFARSLGLEGQKEWSEWCKSGARPPDVPGSPERVYKDCGWESTADWLGTKQRGEPSAGWRSFEEARGFVRSLGFRNYTDWRGYAKSEGRPVDIPYSPHKAYGGQWASWGDWLGTGYIANARRRYRSYEEARAFVRSLGLRTHREWVAYCRSGEKPDDIPSNPDEVYGDKWKRRQ